MRLAVYPSAQGDCLLLTSREGRRLLVDGGMAHSYRASAAHALAQLHARAETIDLVCISHIDSDHISGILQMMDDLVAWRVHEYQLGEGNDGHPEPDNPHPPDVGAIWHNSFGEQIGDQAPEVQATLEAVAIILSGAEAGDLRERAMHHAGLGTSIKEALQLSRRIDPRQLGIPLNGPTSGGLMDVESLPDPIDLGDLVLTVIAPSRADLEELRADWKKWLAENRDVVEGLEEQTRRDEARLRGDEVEAVIDPKLAQARTLGDRGQVTTPNLASLMMLVEEGGATVLLTGDGHGADVVRGLERSGRLAPGQGLHFDVHKIPHHGSEHNIDADVLARLTADHYVFCANGLHENPDAAVVEAVIDSRLGPEGVRSANAESAGRFKLWFNSCSAIQEAAGSRHHMEMIESLVARRAEETGGGFDFEFLAGAGPSDALEIELGPA